MQVRGRLSPPDSSQESRRQGPEALGGWCSGCGGGGGSGRLRRRRLVVVVMVVVVVEVRRLRRAQAPTPHTFGSLR